MKGSMIFFLDFRYNFQNIFNIISKSFATYECCHSCLYFIFYALPKSDFCMDAQTPPTNYIVTVHLIMKINCQSHKDLFSKEQSTVKNS